MEPQKNKPYMMVPEKYKTHKMKLENGKELHKKTWNEEIADLFLDKQPNPVSPPKNPIYVPVTEAGPRSYRIWDVNQKFFCLVNNVLVASPQNSNTPELLMEVFPNAVVDPKMQPIFMGPDGRKHSLSCVKSDEGQPQLQLVETDIKKLYEKREKLFNFTFYSKTDGSPETCSFESAEFPGWFISTSSEPNKPVRLSRQGGAENTQFYFERN